MNSNQDNVSLTEFTKAYKKMKKKSNSMSHIDDTLDKLHQYIISDKPISSIHHQSRDEYIEAKLKETLCLCSIYYGIEYDLHHSLL